MIAIQWSNQQDDKANNNIYNMNNSENAIDNNGYIKEENHTDKLILNDNNHMYAEKYTKMKNERDLLTYYERLEHLPFKYIQQAVSKVLLPRKLYNCRIPMCPSYLHEKQSRNLWRTSKIHKSMYPTTITKEKSFW
jgi:hypothetical protein